MSIILLLKGALVRQNLMLRATDQPLVFDQFLVRLGCYG